MYDARDEPTVWVRWARAVCAQRTLLEGEVAALMAAEHKPNFILRILTELIWQADLLEGQTVRLDETMSFFEEQIGTCERSVHCAESHSWEGGSIHNCQTAGLAGLDLDL